MRRELFVVVNFGPFFCKDSCFVELSVVRSKCRGAVGSKQIAFKVRGGKKKRLI
jgi:hypothetical protein